MAENQELKIVDLYNEVTKKYTYPHTFINLPAYHVLIDIKYIYLFDFYGGNRKIISSHIKNIYKSLEKKFKNNEEIFLGGIIIIAYYDNQFYIIDGQHRIQALKKLYKKNKKKLKYKIRCDVVFCKDEKNLRSMLRIINNVEKTDTLILKTGTKTILYEKFKEEFDIKIFSKSLNPRTPYINLDLLCRKIVKNNLHKHNIEYVFQLLKDINDEFTEYTIEELSQINDKKIKITDSMISKAKKYKMFLGFDKEYSFVKEIKNRL